jgi:hypothetical protein
MLSPRDRCRLAGAEHIIRDGVAALVRSPAVLVFILAVQDLVYVQNPNSVK